MLQSPLGGSSYQWIALSDGVDLELHVEPDKSYNHRLIFDKLNQVAEIETPYEVEYPKTEDFEEEAGLEQRAGAGYREVDAEYLNNLMDMDVPDDSGTVFGLCRLLAEYESTEKVFYAFAEILMRPEEHDTTKRALAMMARRENLQNFQEIFALLQSERPYGPTRVFFETTEEIEQASQVFWSNEMSRWLLRCLLCSTIKTESGH
jgi:hypothetical protein